VIERLTAEFAHLDDKNYPGDVGIQARTKIGEALLRVTKILADLTPKHKNQLINPFLSQLGHPGKLSCLQIKLKKALFTYEVSYFTDSSPGACSTNI
jgi:hypothetical protein